MSKYNIHSDFKKYENMKLPLYPLLLPLINILITMGVNQIKPTQGVSVTKKKITGYENGTIEKIDSILIGHSYRKTYRFKYTND